MRAAWRACSMKGDRGRQEKIRGLRHGRQGTIALWHAVKRASPVFPLSSPVFFCYQTDIPLLACFRRFYYRRTCIRYVRILHVILKQVLLISISYAIRFHLICVTFASHMRYISISYAIRFYLICVTFLSHMRYVSISYAIRFHTICRRNTYGMF